MTPEQENAFRALVQKFSIEDGYAMSLHIEDLKEKIDKQTKIIRMLATRMAALEKVHE